MVRRGYAPVPPWVLNAMKGIGVYQVRPNLPPRLQRLYDAMRQGQVQRYYDETLIDDQLDAEDDWQGGTPFKIYYDIVPVFMPQEMVAGLVHYSD